MLAMAMKAGAHARRLLQAAMDENLILPEAPGNRQGQADMLARGALMGLVHAATSAGALDAALLAARCLMAMQLPVATSGLQVRSGALRICIGAPRLCWLRSCGMPPCGRTWSSAAWSSQACRRRAAPCQSSEPRGFRGVPVLARSEGWSGAEPAGGSLCAGR